MLPVLPSGIIARCPFCAAIGRHANALRQIRRTVIERGARQSLFHRVVYDRIRRDPPSPTKIYADPVFPIAVSGLDVHDFRPKLCDPPGTLERFVLISGLWIGSDVLRISPENIRSLLLVNS